MLKSMTKTLVETTFLEGFYFNQLFSKLNFDVSDTDSTLCLKKNILDIFDCKFKTNYQILIVFGMNIPDKTCHQITVQFLTSPNVCFCTT